MSVFFLAERFILRFESVSAKQRRCHLVDHIPDFFLRRIKPNPAQPVDQTLGVAQKNFYYLKTQAQNNLKTSQLRGGGNHPFSDSELLVTYRGRDCFAVVSIKVVERFFVNFFVCFLINGQSWT